MSISKNIRFLRQRQGWGQDTLAEKLGYKSYTTIQKWESEASEPPLKTVHKLAEIFHVDINDLVNVDIDDSYFSYKLPAAAVPLSPAHRIPILGRISAGLPLYAEEHIEGYTYTDLNNGGEYFGLRVQGDSMSAARIQEGDTLIVRRQETADNGQIAVVMVGDDEATVKRFYQTGNIVTLMPQSTNPVHQPQIYDIKKTPVRIIGLVVRIEINV